MIDFKGKTVLVTGHTGFKGTWLCAMLDVLGAEVHGYSLKPPTEPNLFDLTGMGSKEFTKIGDIVDYDSLADYYKSVSPDYVIHMAAQPIVREGYRDPRTTFQSNVMGTVNILECVRQYGAESFLNVTTDKVYKNNNSGIPFTESDRLGGSDPYSNSKSCSELVTASYSSSFKGMCPISTARSGNVIGGGDFSPERIVPDCIRAIVNDKQLTLRNPDSVRPFQHVLEPLFAYLKIISKQAEDRSYAGSYNIGPDPEGCVKTIDLANMVFSEWGKNPGIQIIGDQSMPESGLLRLDNTKMKEVLGIKPVWGIKEAVSKTVEWSKVWASDGDVNGCMYDQIIEYLERRGIRVRMQERIRS